MHYQQTCLGGESGRLTSFHFIVTSFHVIVTWFLRVEGEILSEGGGWRYDDVKWHQDDVTVTRGDFEDECNKIFNFKLKLKINGVFLNPTHREYVSNDLSLFNKRIKSYTNFSCQPSSNVCWWWEEVFLTFPISFFSLAVKLIGTPVERHFLKNVDFFSLCMVS